MNEPDFTRLTSSHFYAWKNGLKTGLYYLRSMPAANPISFGLDPESIIRIEKKYGINKQQKTEDSDKQTSKQNAKVNAFLLKYGEQEEEDTTQNTRDNFEACEMCSG